ncbi:MAG: Sec-independent protein translocase protein TatB [Thermohalobaculum sp.]|nr:Sec-independent protein translocase protein TatB [Thermohalobaculum sp.]
MFDIGWSELLVVGMLALIVVGPKELPGLLRTIGQYVGKARSVAREFQRSMEDAAREADIGALKELRDAKRDLDSLKQVDFAEQARRSGASLGSSAKPAAPAAPAAAAPEPAATPAPEATPAPRPTGTGDA